MAGAQVQHFHLMLEWLPRCHEAFLVDMLLAEFAMAHIISLCKERAARNDLQKSRVLKCICTAPHNNSLPRSID